MKKIRTMSNLVADELRMALDESGIQLDEDVFEGHVSDIVEMISESVDEACENCDEEDEEVTEGTFYFSAGDATLGGMDIAEGEYVEVEEDEDGNFYVNIYDEDGELKSEGIVVSEDDINAFLENAEELSDDEDVEEAPIKKFKVQNGKKVKLSKNQIIKQKLKARGKLKKGYKVVNGKQVKMTAAERMARKKLGKKLAKKGKAKRLKSLKKARQLAAGSDSGTCTVKEGFDISVNGMKLSLEEGDEIKFEDGKITVYRDGNVIFSEVQVSESFMDKCFEEQVLEKKCNEDDDEDEEDDVEVEAGEEEDPEDSDDTEDEDKDLEECGVKEGALLTFKSNKGYVLVSEGVELPMGNRIRARATLTSKGYNVTPDMLDRASNGKVVVL